MCPQADPEYKALPFSEKLSKGPISQSHLANSRLELSNLYLNYKEHHADLLKAFERAIHIDIRIGELEGKLVPGQNLGGIETITDRQVLETLKKSAVLECTSHIKAIEKFSKELKDKNPLDPGAYNFLVKDLSKTTAKLDLINLLAEELDPGTTHPTKLFKSFYEKATKKETDYQGLSEVNEKFQQIKRETPFQYTFDEKDKKYRSELNDANSKGDFTKVNELAEAYFNSRSNRKPNSTQIDLAANTNFLDEKLYLEGANYRTPITSEILLKSSRPLLLNPNERLEELTEEQSKKASMFKQILWESSLPKTPELLNGELDFRVINSGYSSLKRLGVLVQALNTRLSEIDEVPDNGERRNARTEAIDQYWSLYHGTGKEVSREMGVSIARSLGTTNKEETNDVVYILASVDRLKSFDVESSFRERMANGTLKPGESLPQSILISSCLEQNIQNELMPVSNRAKETISKLFSGELSLENVENLLKQDYGTNLTNAKLAYEKIKVLVKPYESILSALATQPLNSQMHLYTNENFLSSKELFDITAGSSSSTMTAIRSTLEKMGASPSKVKLHLSSFQNSNPKEAETLKPWIDSFPYRFIKEMKE